MIRSSLGLKLDLSTDRSVRQFKGRRGSGGAWGESAGILAGPVGRRFSQRIFDKGTARLDGELNFETAFE